MILLIAITSNPLDHKRLTTDKHAGVNLTMNNAKLSTGFSLMSSLMHSSSDCAPSRACSLLFAMLSAA